MKEYTRVKLITEREKYTKAGVSEGMQGVILDSRQINGQWHVCFEGEILQNKNGTYCTTEIILPVNENDLIEI